MISAKPFYMIRHGETTANRDGVFSGNIDVELTDQGREQAALARALVESLDIKPITIVHSHLRRARNTAKIINQNLNLPMHETPLIGEHNFGDWEGKSWEEFCPKFYAGDNPPNGETHEEFGLRVKDGINYALEKEGPVLIVCHGGVFRGFHFNYKREVHGIKNCKLYSFTPSENKEFPWDVRLIG